MLTHYHVSLTLACLYTDILILQQQFAQFMAQASTLVEPGTENLTNVWNPREHSVTNGLFGKVWFQYPSDKKVNYQFAINHEGIIVNNLAMAWSQAHAQAQGNPQAMTRLPN